MNSAKKDKNKETLDKMDLLPIAGIRSPHFEPTVKSGYWNTAHTISYRYKYVYYIQIHVQSCALIVLNSN